MWKILVLAVIFNIILFSSCRDSNTNGNSEYDDGSSATEDNDDNDCNVEERDDDYDCTSALPRVRQAIIKIGFQRINYFVQNNVPDNNYNYCNNNQTQGKEGVVGSPLSTWYSSAILALYSEKETLDELLAYTGLENKDECRCMMKLLTRLNKAFVKGFYYFSADIIADTRKYYFTEIFKRDVIDYYNGKALNCNFSRPQMCARKVNKIAATKTGNVIRDVVSKQEASTVFNQDQIIDIVIGTYYKPVFKMSLNTANKTTGIYYGLYEPTLTEFVYQEFISNSTESKSLNAQIIQLPLTNNNVNLFVIVPNSRCGLSSLVAKLSSEPQILLDEIKYLTSGLIRLTLPIYKSLTTVVNLVPVLRSTGEINRVLNITESQIIDSCGKPLNRSISYIHEKATLMLSPIGGEPYKPASENDCCECGEPLNFRIDIPAVFIYLINGVIVGIVIQ